MTCNTTFLEDGLDIAEVLDIHDTGIKGYQTCRILLIPLPARFTLVFFCQQRCLVRQIKELLIGMRRERIGEDGGLLAMSVKTATVGTHFTWTNLMPGLRHVQHHAVAVKRLKGVGCVGGNFYQETRVRIAVGINWLLP